MTSEALPGKTVSLKKRILKFFLAMFATIFVYILVTNIFVRTRIPGVIMIPVTLEKGNYELSHCVILPLGSLNCKPGADIKVLARGKINCFGKVNISGSKDEPVTFAGDDWVGLNFWYSKSSIDYAVISNAHTAINSHGSHIELSNSEIIDARVCCVAVNKKGSINIDASTLSVKDAAANVNINIVSIRKAKLNMKNSLVICPATAKKIDCVDIGESKGCEITRSIFIGSPLRDTDALDIDGYSSDMTFTRNMIYNFDDKAISSGEGSSCFIKENVFYKCGIGVAGKDGSSMAAENNTYIELGIGIKCFIEKIPDDGTKGCKITSKNALFCNVKKDEDLSGKATSIDIVNLIKIDGDLEQQKVFMDFKNWNFINVAPENSEFGANQDFSKLKKSFKYFETHPSN